MRWLEKYLWFSGKLLWCEMDRNVGEQNISYSLENQENPFVSPGFSLEKDAEICLQMKQRSWGVLSGRNISKMANCDILHYGWGYFQQDKRELSALPALEGGQSVVWPSGIL